MANARGQKQVPFRRILCVNLSDGERITQRRTGLGAAFGRNQKSFNAQPKAPAHVAARPAGAFGWALNEMRAVRKL